MDKTTTDTHDHVYVFYLASSSIDYWRKQTHPVPLPDADKYVVVAPPWHRDTDYTGGAFGIRQYRSEGYKAMQKVYFNCRSELEEAVLDLPEEELLTLRQECLDLRCQLKEAETRPPEDLDEKIRYMGVIDPYTWQCPDGCCDNCTYFRLAR